jgi:hypothetical protein
MGNEGYVSFNSILERVNRDKPENAVYKIADAKEWLWEAVKKIGGESSYIREVIELKIEEGKILIPSYVQGIRSIKGANGELIAQTYDSLDDDIYDVYKYIINGRYIFTNYAGDTLNVEVLKFPIDSSGNPLIENNVYVISAVQSYLIERIVRKMWLSGKIADKIYNALEREWLFYVRAASNSLSIPSMDNMEDWRILHNMIPGLNENYSTKLKGSNNVGYPIL